MLLSAFAMWSILLSSEEQGRPAGFFFAQRNGPSAGEQTGAVHRERAVIGDRDTLDNPLAQNPFQPYFGLNLCTACADKEPPEDCAVRTRYNAASIIQLGGVVHFSGLFRICEWSNSASTALGYRPLSVSRQGEWFL
jgi:hypothetical protein